MPERNFIRAEIERVCVQAGRQRKEHPIQPQAPRSRKPPSRSSGLNFRATCRGGPSSFVSKGSTRGARAEQSQDYVCSGAAKPLVFTRGRSDSLASV
jgi:hypothetical protein